MLSNSLTSKIFVCFLFNLCFLNGQEVKQLESQHSLEVYPFFEANPLPAFITNPKIYPYHKFDGYEDTKQNGVEKIITLENDFIEVTVLPNVGGKIWGAIDKSNGNEFIYKNEVLKFRNIAMRGPWTSGGIEFNFGIIGHHPNTATPVDYHIQELKDGTKVCTVGSIDLPSRTQWRVSIILPPDQSAFRTEALWYNPTPVEQSYYNWMTAAAKAKSDLVFYTPGNVYLEHNGNPKKWPFDFLNRNLSKYKENNFNTHKSYHVVGEYNDFFGGYYTNSNVGFGHWGRYDEIPGQKLWLWSLARDGGIWENLLTDNDGQYIEYQAGRLFVQYFPGETNPISQATFEPHVADEWTEVWFPIKNLNGLKEASQWGALNVEKTTDSIFVYLNPFKQAEGHVSLINNLTGETKQKQLNVNPNEVYRYSFNIEQSWLDYVIQIQSLQLKFNATPQTIKRDFSPTKQLLKKDTALRYLEALDAKRYREFLTAEKLFKQVLTENPLNLDARKELGELMFQNGKYEEASSIIQSGLQIDTYHPGLNYVAGIIAIAMKDWVNGKEFFGWAARSIKYRSSSYTQIGQILLFEKQFDEALHYTLKALKANSTNINAHAQKIIIQRKLGNTELAIQSLKKLEKIDPLHHVLPYEKYRLKEGNLDAILESHRSEFPEQTFLELALFYHNRGLDQEALTILSLGPKKLLNELWISYLKKDSQKLDILNQKSIAFVFPFRRESLYLFDWLTSQTDNWKGAYLLAINLIGKNQIEKGISILNSLENKPDESLFYLIRGKILEKFGHGHFQKDFITAYEKNHKNWRIALTYANMLYENNEFINSLEVLQKAVKRYPKNYMIGMQKVKTLNALQKYDKARTLLSTLKILPYENASEGRSIYVQTYLKSTLDAIAQKQFDKAIKYLGKMLEWPEELGVGKPYNPDQRLHNFILSYCYQQMNDTDSRDLMLQNIINYHNENKVGNSGKINLLTILALQQLEGRESALNYMKQLKYEEDYNSNSTEDIFDYFFKHEQTAWDYNFINKTITFIQE